MSKRSLHDLGSSSTEEEIPLAQSRGKRSRKQPKKLEDKPSEGKLPFMTFFYHLQSYDLCVCMCMSC